MAETAQDGATHHDSFPHTPHTTLLSAHTTHHSPIRTHHTPLSYPHTPHTALLSAHTTHHSPIRTHHRPFSYPHTPLSYPLTQVDTRLSHPHTQEPHILVSSVHDSRMFLSWVRHSITPVKTHTHQEKDSRVGSARKRATVSPRKRPQMIGLVQERLCQHHVLGALWVESLLLPQRLYAKCVAVSAPPSYRSRQTRPVSWWRQVSECKSK